MGRRNTQRLLNVTRNALRYVYRRNTLRVTRNVLRLASLWYEFYEFLCRGRRLAPKRRFSYV